MLEISPQGPSGLSGKICLCGIGAAGTKVMELPSQLPSAP